MQLVLLALIAYLGELKARTCPVHQVELRAKVLELALKIQGQSPVMVLAVAEVVAQVALEVKEASSRDLLLAQAS